jgi:hypothetical protein
MPPAAFHHVHIDINLVGANLLVLLLALLQGWGPLALLWPWWLQSLVIGYRARQRLLRAARARAAPGLEPSAVDCLILHYGLFHMVLLIFLIAFTGMADQAALLPEPVDAAGGAVPMLESGIGWLDWPLFVGLGYVFWRAHDAAARRHGAAELAGKPSTLMLMFLPYVRILPMQLAVVALLAAAESPSLAVVVTIKTMLDVLSAHLCHQVLRGALQPVAVRPPE